MAIQKLMLIMTRMADKIILMLMTGGGQRMEARQPTQIEVIPTAR
jgi:hypothetical protein